MNKYIKIAIILIMLLVFSQKVLATEGRGGSLVSSTIEARGGFLVSSTDEGKTVPLDTSHSKSESEREYEDALDEGMVKVINLLKSVYNVLIILVPITLLVFGVVDLLKAVGSQDEKAMKAAQSALGRRVMWAIVALLAFNIMKLVFTIFEGGSEWLKYWW